MPTDAELQDLHQRGLSAAEIALRLGLSASSVRGRLSRSRDTELEDLRRQVAELTAQLEEQHDADDLELGQPWVLQGDFMVVGDVHIDTLNTRMRDAMLAVAEKHLPTPRRLILAGDTFTADAFSLYDAVVPRALFPKEVRDVGLFFERCLEVFEAIYIMPGNHDWRVSKRTNAAIVFPMLIRMASSDPRILVSQFSWLKVQCGDVEWRITHGSNYSVNQLVVADTYASKYKANIISFHEHHLAKGWDRFKTYVVVNGGGLFDPLRIVYSQIEAGP